MDTTKHKYLSIPFILFFIMIITMSLVSLYLSVNSNINNTYFNEEFTPVFYDSNDNVIDNTLNLYKVGENSQIYFIVPEDLPENLSLCFRSRHLYFSVSTGTETIYETITDNSPLYTSSTGVDWIMIPLKSSYRGQKIYIDYQLAYNKANAGFDRATLTYSNNFILNVINEKVTPVFLCVLYLSIGLILILMGTITYKLSRNSALFWLGAFALSVAAYCFLETQVLQVFVENSRLIHLLVMFAMIIIPIPAVTYINAALDMKPRWLTQVFSIVVFTLFLIIFCLNSFEVIDYHECLPIMQGLVGIAVVMMAIGIVTYIVSQIKKDKKVSTYVLLLIIGALSIMITGIVDIIKYWLVNVTDPASTVRYGFIVFLISFAAASSEQVVKAFQTSSRAKIIAKLAYEDGLTGLRNRTSYKEMIQKIEAERINTGIIMMDLNNLKYVNDTFGHENGDEMILATAGIISKVFSKIDGSFCYRIGGDEFVVLIQNKAIKTSCKEGINELRKAYENFNLTENRNYKLVIAAGYSVYSYRSKKTFKEVADEADSCMYTNKRKLKNTENKVGDEAIET